jgi:hypothetical protein
MFQGFAVYNVESFSLSAIVWLFTDEIYKPPKMQHSGFKSRHMCKVFSCNVSCLGAII